MAKARYLMIGGFLGAGKTTAIVRLAQYVTEKKLRVGLITNDQSLGLVDTTRVRAAGFPVREITGGCFCCKFNSLIEASARLAAETKPDILIAEPVGSCTDLQATVSYPLRQLFGENYEVAPLSVLVDPVRCGRILGIGQGGNFSEKVLYVYRKQLEEAEYLVINKVDLLDAGARAELVAGVKERYPKAQVLAVSAQTGEGLEDWFEKILTEKLGIGPAVGMPVDYDTYAEGEALLGWLNTTGELVAQEALDGNQWLGRLTETLRQKLAGQKIEIAHLKMTLVPDEGPDLAAISLTGSDREPMLTHRLKGTIQRGVLTVNLRAEADPEQLQRIVRELLAQAPAVRIKLGEIHAFRPGRPNPTHRYLSPP